MENEKFLQALGSVLIAAFGGLLLAVRYFDRLHPNWRDALIYAALFNLSALAVRVCSSLGYIGQSQARTVNGLIAAVFVLALAISIVANWRMRRCQRLSDSSV